MLTRNVNGEVGPGEPMVWATSTGAVLAGLAILSWESHDVPGMAGAEMLVPSRGHAPLTTLGVGALVLALQLFLLHRYRRPRRRPWRCWSARRC
ncbi:hypothetical protein [Actinoplanes sp. NPDC048796]|uniref:hypothetical protein n=1 Tax=Actinoplanes sp. NPDC048796 TaxID=3155640 RepID=UPI0033D6B2B5